MITLDYLNEYEKKMKKYNYEIEKSKKDIKEENSKNYMDSVSGSSNTYPYEKRHFAINGISSKTINFLEKRKKSFEKRKIKLEKELKYILYNTEDILIAEIIEKRYIKNAEWKKISMDLKYSDESGARKYFNRFFKIK